MSRTPYHNPLDHGVYIGNVYVPAHGTRTVEAALLPAAPAAAQAPQEDPLAALAKGKASELIAALPGLSPGDCDALLDLERAGKNRSTVVEALELRKLEIADEAEQARKDAEAAAQAANGEGGTGATE